MRGFACFAVAIAGSLVFADGSHADVYKFVDNTGHVFYTDRPGHAGYRRIIRSSVTITPARGLRGSPSTRSLVSSMLQRQASPRLERNRREYTDLIDSAANRHSLDPALLHAIIRAESAYNPDAMSNKGAVGLMQLMPATAARYGVRDRRDPVENIEGGARYLSELIEMFQSDLRLAVAAYNAGENSVKRHGYRVPPIPETQDYVVRVLDYYRRMN
jgi:soluble lytic murein transglycosylase-like protein